MKNNRIQITKKEYGDDGYRTFSIRVKEETVQILDKVARDSNRSRNELINIFLEYGVSNFEITD